MTGRETGIPAPLALPELRTPDRLAKNLGVTLSYAYLLTTAQQSITVSPPGFQD